jgi:hypothetical protein
MKTLCAILFNTVSLAFVPVGFVGYFARCGYSFGYLLAKKKTDWILPKNWRNQQL